MDFTIQLAYQLSSESKYHNNSLILLSPFRSSARVHMGYCLVEETESTIQWFNNYLFIAGTTRVYSSLYRWLTPLASTIMTQISLSRWFINYRSRTIVIQSSTKPPIDQIGIEKQSSSLKHETRGITPKTHRAQVSAISSTIVLDSFYCDPQCQVICTSLGKPPKQKPTN